MLIHRVRTGYSTDYVNTWGSATPPPPPRLNCPNIYYCHRYFRNTTTWENCDEAFEINRKQWLDNQYPESCSSRVESQALEKIIGEGKNKKNMAEKRKPCDYSSDSPKIVMVQFQGSHSQTLVNKGRDITNAHIK